MIFSIQNEKDVLQGHKADNVLASKALEKFKASDDNWKNIAELGFAGVMKAKFELDIGIININLLLIY